MLEISFQTCLELEYCVGFSEAALAVLNIFVGKKHTQILLFRYVGAQQFSMLETDRC